jgi:O-antigen/teichoic acid export membrane protein
MKNFSDKSRIDNSFKNIFSSFFGFLIILIAQFTTRIFFLKYLGPEYLGVSGLFSNLISLLSLTELGIGSAIIFGMYKPLNEKNYILLNKLLNYYKKAYIIISIIVLIIGLILTPFINLFINDQHNIENLRFIFIIFILNSSLSYLFGYKRAILIADQKKFIDNINHFLFYLIKTIIQITVLILFESFILYLFTQSIIILLENFKISKIVDKKYKFINKFNKEKLNIIERKTVFKNVNALMNHRIGSVIVNSTDNILISRYISLSIVGFYSNYLLVFQALDQIYSLFFQSFTASIGNLEFEKDISKKIQVYKVIDFLNFWIYCFSSIALLLLINPFIKLWLGNIYIFSDLVVTLMVINFYISGRRKSLLVFRDALGLFLIDKYKPILESFLNLVLSLLFINLYGLSGVILGTIISTLLTSFLIEPYVVFKHGLLTNFKLYYFDYLKQLVIFLVLFFLSNYFYSLFFNNSFVSFFLSIFFIFFFTNGILFFIFKNNINFILLKKIIMSKFL